MNKESILNFLKEQMQVEYDKAKKAYDTSHQHATSSELKSEGKYDTRSIEAGYLAGAQKKRVLELEQEIKLLDEIDLTLSNQTVSVGSLVKIKLNDLERTYFISSTSGGTMVQHKGEVILVISAFSPIGVEVIGLSAGDSFEIEVQGKPREYQVTHIY
jgi:transcription elongation GreA/GreB family factor